MLSCHPIIDCTGRVLATAGMPPTASAIRKWILLESDSPSMETSP